MTGRRAGAVKRGRHGNQQGSPPKRRRDAREAMRAKGTGKRKNALGGPHKSLIRLDSDKENPSLSLVGFGRVLLDLAQFGPIWLNLDSALDFLGCCSLHIAAADIILGSPPAAQPPPSRLKAPQGASRSKSLENTPLSCDVINERHTIVYIAWRRLGASAPAPRARRRSRRARSGPRSSPASPRRPCRRSSSSCRAGSCPSASSAGGRRRSPS
jgi:hypothetical protein